MPCACGQPNRALQARLGRGPDDATTALVLEVVILAVVATARWHAARNHAQQAEAAQRAVDQATAAAPLAAMHTYGQRLSAPARRRQARAVRNALSHLADRLSRRNPRGGAPALETVIRPAPTPSG
ncbi:hypothetical protein JCM4914_49050 [Streptomyces platensis subsp. malvinus]